MQNNPPPGNPPPNYPPPPPNYPPPGQSFSPPPAPKKSKTPWIIAGVLGCLAIVVVIFLLIGGLAYFGYKSANDIVKNANSRGGTSGGGSTSRSTTPAAGTTRYTNDRSKFSGTLAQNYVDFSFDYPEDWTLVPNETKNFVKVEHTDEHGTTMENFAVGWISATGTFLDKQLLPQLAKQLNDQFSQGFENYEKVSEGEGHLGDYDGYDIKFTADLPGAAGGGAKVYGRAFLIPPPSGEKHGVALIMLTTDRAEGISSPDDVGVKGEMPTIINSFHLGS
ncbi:MAG: hypothetical protein LC746_16295 [Acidobacteria bacterium]|nr:hypothetical protein [Acidobacteriota bacterium]